MNGLTLGRKIGMSVYLPPTHYMSIKQIKTTPVSVSTQALHGRHVLRTLTPNDREAYLQPPTKIR